MIASFRPPFTLFLFLASLSLIQCREGPVATEPNLPDLRPISGSAETLVETSNAFSVDLFKAIQQQVPDENIFISPLSVDIALHMTANGASGETKAVMKETLGVTDLTDEEVNEAAKTLTEQLMSMDQQVVLAIANSIWFKDTYTLQSGFDQLIREYYDGRIEGLDLGSPASKDIINGWVENQTQGKIKNLIENVSPTDVMFLINAIYFKANWQYQFNAGATKDEPFYLADGSTVSVPMMSNEGTKLRFNYQEDGTQLLEIPYGNGQFNMVILLPSPESTVADLANSLTTEELTKWIAEADTLTTHLMLPKFKTEFKLTLNDVLKGMGMELPFTNRASFGGFFNEGNGEGLYIDRVIHQAFIEVNEEGSEAAAATAVVISFRSSGAEGQPSVIRVDRPFAYFIREKHTGAMLFAGTMMNPAN
ncbi:serpin family protein [Tunicatimonas pelagia]|uniref:serpin family protein n=1 Tax=Tunicatimonas pelagia TaxID=931531 RepID=UPI002665E3A9|nr:serpin family protein [Tunicatimonas pelagia]WKN46239.1 serpin family protein [Tunicatimonas pelagia]